MELGTTWPLVISITVGLMCLFYLWELLRSYKRKAHVDLEGVEAFTNLGGGVDTRLDSACYDAFYAKVYDQLVQPQARVALETKVPVEWMTANQKRSVGGIRVADVGCGAGLHVELFRNMGVRSVVGYDRSTAMITEARRRFPESRFEVGDARQATMMAADSVDLLTMFYFTLYTIPERAEVLKNVFLWLAPGGIFCVHIVNKLKFDPVLEAASPFVGFSVQKYADERITKSSVAFEEFDYEGDFQLHGSRGTYEEIFRFKDGRIRKHEQRVWMPNIDVLVGEIGAVGFKYMQHVDLTAIGYEYNYLFMFTR